MNGAREKRVLAVEDGRPDDVCQNKEAYVLKKRAISVRIEKQVSLEEIFFGRRDNSFYVLSRERK